MWDGIATGFATAVDPGNLVWVVAGCLAGTFIGMMPGLGPITAIALMIPVSYSLDPAAGLIMMAGVYYGAVFGGSTSSILINAPGVASTVATSFDGYPMARRGQAGRALAIAAYASFAGGVAGRIGLAFVRLSAGHARDCLPVARIRPDSAVRAMQRGRFRGPRASLALADSRSGRSHAWYVGTDQSAGVQRFTFGRLDLTDGLSFVLVAMATFALAEAFRMVLAGDEESPPNRFAHARLHPGDAKAVAPAVARSSVLGFLIGVLPGAGATLASFFAYDLQKRFRRHDEADQARGIAAPEAANNAACTGSFVPLLTLGIPGSGTTAILLGVMLSYGVQPGPRLLEAEPAMFWGVIASMYIGNLVLLALNLPLIPYISRIVYLRRRVLVPFVIVFSLLGVYLTSLNSFDVYLMLGFALAGLALRLEAFRWHRYCWVSS